MKTYWDKENKPGVHKGGHETRQYQFLMSNALAEKGLKFDSSLFTVTREKGTKDMLMMLEDQLQRFHWEKKKAADSFGKDRFALTGKVKQKKNAYCKLLPKKTQVGSKNDDLLVCVMMLIYWGRIVIARPGRL